MNCLDNILALPGCTPPAADAILITDWPGIGIQNINDLTDAEHQSIQDVFQKSIRYAKLRIKSDLQHKWQGYSLLCQPYPKLYSGKAETGTEKQGNMMVASAAWGSYLALSIQQIEFIATIAGAAVLNVYDENQDLVYTQAITAVAGVNRVTVNRTFEVDCRLTTFYIQLTGLEFQNYNVNTEYCQLNWEHPYQTCGRICCTASGMYSLRVADDFVFSSDFTKVPFVARMQFVCSLDLFFCERVDLLRKPFGDLAVFYFIKNMVMDTRLSQSSAVKIKFKEEYAADLLQQYDQALSDIAQNLAMPDCHPCFCNNNAVFQQYKV